MTVFHLQAAGHISNVRRKKYEASQCHALPQVGFTAFQSFHLQNVQTLLQACRQQGTSLQFRQIIQIPQARGSAVNPTPGITVLPVRDFACFRSWLISFRLVFRCTGKADVTEIQRRDMSRFSAENPSSSISLRYPVRKIPVSTFFFPFSCDIIAGC
jgi:hypothetical protein